MMHLCNTIETADRKEVGLKNIVLFVHGFMGSTKQFAYLTETVETCGWTHYNLPLAGHNGSIREFARSSVENWKLCVQQTLQEISETYDQVVLVGHSMGGLLLIDNAGQYKPKVQHILAIALPLYTRLTLRELKTNLLFPFKKIPSNDLYLKAAREFCGIHNISALNAAKLLPNSLNLLKYLKYMRQHIGDFDIPTTVINSLGDELVSMKTLKHIRNNHNFHSITIEKSGHFFYEEAEQELIKETLAHILQCV